MSSKISNKLNNVFKEHKSCFNCLNFKIKPFQSNLKDISINFNLTTTKVRCCKGMFDKISSEILKNPVNKRNNKPISLEAAIKSIDRYKIISASCKEYSSLD